MHGIRLQTRFIVYFTSLVVAIMALVVLVVEKRMGDIIARQGEQRGLSVAHNLAAVCQGSLVAYNYIALTQSAERAQRDEEGIADVIILNKEGRVAAYSGHPERQGTILDDPTSVRAAATITDLVVPTVIPRGDSTNSQDRGLDIAVPVFVDNSGEKWGLVRIRLSTEDMHRRIRDTRLTLLGVGLLAVGLGAGGSFLMARRVTGPLADLVGATIRAAGGDLETRIEIRTGDELEELASNFNAMVQQIRVNQGAVEELNRSLERRGSALRALHEVGRDLSSTTERIRILTMTVEAMRAVSNAQEVAVVAAVAAGEPPRWAGLPLETIGDGQRLSIEASLGRLRAGRRVEPPTPCPDSLAALPLYQGDLLFGWLFLPKAAAAGRDVADLLAILAGQTSASLHNVRLLEERLATERLSAMGQMISALAHDLRNPMTAIKGYAGMIDEFELPRERQRESARLVVEECDRMSAMIDEVLDFSRGGKTRLRLGPVTVQDLATQTQRILERGFRAKSVSFRTELAYAGEIVVDADRLRRVILNIAENALDAMEPGGCFTLSSTLAGDNVDLTLHDTGRGIPEAIQARVFEPFFTYGKARGIGLGMAIARRLVEDHGGSIRLESRPGQGTRFSLRLPLARVTSDRITQG